MKKAFTTIVVSITAMVCAAPAAQADEPGCLGEWRALAAHELGGLGEMMKSNAYVRKGSGNECLGRDFNPYLREAVCN